TAPRTSPPRRPSTIATWRRRGVSADRTGARRGPAGRVRPKRLARAVRWSAALHEQHQRKGSGAPYVAHPLGVAALVLGHGGSGPEAIAALLHDVVEDAGVSIDEIRDRFGRSVARIVEGCTDVPTTRRSARVRDRGAATWWKRRRRVLRHL